MKSSSQYYSSQPYRAFRRSALVSGTTLALFSGSALVAGDASWSLGTGGGNWNQASAWTPSGSPGLTSGNTTSTDTATFDSTTRTIASTIAVDAGRNIGNITFNTTNGNGYTLNGGSLVLSANGTILTTGGGAGQSNINTGMTLQGNYTFTANSNLQLNSTAASFTAAAGLGSVTMTIGGTYGAGSSNTVLTTGNITESAGSTLTLVKTGSGRWQTNGNNTYTGGTIIKAGYLGLGLATAKLGTGVITLGDTSGSNDVILAAGSNVSLANDINVIAGSSGNLTLMRPGGSGPGTFSGNITLGNNLVLVHNNGAAQNLNISGNITGTGNIIDRSLTAGTTNISGSINMTGGITNDTTAANSPLTISGSLGSNVTGVTQNSTLSVITLSGANTNYAGTTTINQGNITISGSGTLGNGRAPLVVNNTNTGAGRSNLLTLSTTLDTTVGSLSGTIATPSSGTNNATITTQTSRNFTVNQTTPGSFAGVIGGSGSFTLGGSSNNTLTLSGINTYSGGTTINNGTLALGHATNTLADSGAVTVSGGTLAIGANSDTVGAVTLSSGSITGSTGVLTASSFGVQSGSISAKLAGNAPLTKSASGNVTITGALNTTNTAGNVIRVTGGSSGSNSILSLSPSVSSVTGANSNNNSVSIGDTFGDYAVFNQTAGTVNSTSISIGNLGTGTYNLSGGTANTNSLTMAFTGPFSNTGEAFLNVSGTGSLNVYSNGKLVLGTFYARTSTVNQTGGTVSFYSDAGTTLGGTGGLAFNGGAGSYTLSGGTLALPNITLLASGGGAGGGTGALNFNGGTLSITNASFSVPSGVTFNVKGDGAVANSGANIDTGSLAVTINAPLVHSGPNAIDGGLTKLGTGTLRLGGNNTYTGPTTVNNGTLELSGSGSINASSGITVNGGLFKNNSSVAITAPFTFTSGTIGGTNLSGISVTIGTGQKLSPGNSPGLLTTGDQTWNAGGSFDFEINDATGLQDTNWDRTLIVGTLTLGTVSNVTPFTINLISLNGLVAGEAANFNEALNQSWVFATATSIAGTAFAADQFVVNTTSFQNAFTGSFGVTKSGDELLLTYTAIPEPSTCAMLAGVATLGLAAYRRRRRQKVAA